MRCFLSCVGVADVVLAVKACLSVLLMCCGCVATQATANERVKDRLSLDACATHELVLLFPSSTASSPAALL